MACIKQIPLSRFLWNIYLSSIAQWRKKYSYIYPISIQLKRTRRCFAWELLTPIFLLSASFSIIIFFFDVTLCDTYRSATIMSRRNSVWKSRARVKGISVLPKTIGRKKLRTRRAIIYRGGAELFFFPFLLLLHQPRSSVPTALWQKFKGRRVIARAARWSIADRAERRAEVGRQAERRRALSLTRSLARSRR